MYFLTQNLSKYSRYKRNLSEWLIKSIFFDHYCVYISKCPLLSAHKKGGKEGLLIICYLPDQGIAGYAAVETPATGTA